MRKWIIWSFDRGSFQYDVLCGLILAAIFLIPSGQFNDRPAYRRISSVEDVRAVVDGDGNQVYTVKVDKSVTDGETEELARRRLRDYLQSEGELNVYRVEQVENIFGGLEAYAFWLVR